MKSLTTSIWCETCIFFTYSTLEQPSEIINSIKLCHYPQRVLVDEIENIFYFIKWFQFFSSLLWKKIFPVDVKNSTTICWNIYLSRNQLQVLCESLLATSDVILAIRNAGAQNSQNWLYDLIIEHRYFPKFCKRDSSSVVSWLRIKMTPFTETKLFLLMIRYKCGFIHNISKRSSFNYVRQFSKDVPLSSLRKILQLIKRIIDRKFSNVWYIIFRRKSVDHQTNLLKLIYFAVQVQIIIIYNFDYINFLFFRKCIRKPFIKRFNGCLSWAGVSRFFSLTAWPSEFALVVSHAIQIVWSHIFYRWIWYYWMVWIPLFHQRICYNFQ